MSKLHFTGIVRIMNHVREALSQPLDPQQRRKVIQNAKEAAEYVEAVCQKYGEPLDQIPKPTYRAYQYLKAVAENRQPPAPSQRPTQPARPKLAIKNMVSYTNVIHARLLELARSAGSKRLSARSPKVAEGLAGIQKAVEDIEAMAESSQASPVDLPAPSRRAYQWLKFLSDPENLETHLQALQTILSEADNPARRRKLPNDWRQFPLDVEFYHANFLYKTKVDRKRIHLIVHEGYIDAPRAVLDALVSIALDPQTKPGINRVKKYAAGEEFQEISLALELEGYGKLEEENDPRLQAAFQRLNKAYFGNQLSTPRLTWNKTITHRKLGHYQHQTDTVMLSITLDQPKVPAYVLDFVLYHELLHKKLGMRLSKGRVYAHTPEFRTEERKFKDYDRAIKFIGKLGEKLG